MVAGVTNGLRTWYITHCIVQPGSFSMILTILTFSLVFQICYFFYKNIHFGFTIFYYEAHAAFSGQAVYNDWYMALFNVFFTSLPVIALGVLDQDISSRLKIQVCTASLLQFTGAACVRTFVGALIHVWGSLSAPYICP